MKREAEDRSGKKKKISVLLFYQENGRKQSEKNKTRVQSDQRVQPLPGRQMTLNVDLDLKS